MSEPALKVGLRREVMRLHATSQQDRALSAFTKTSFSHQANQLQTIILKYARTPKFFVPKGYAKVRIIPQTLSHVD
jgi:hypothetical protein